VVLVGRCSRQAPQGTYVAKGTRREGPPAVKYRGIFLNDEEPALGGWSREKFGGLNSKMYSHMFELLAAAQGELHVARDVVVQVLQ